MSPRHVVIGNVASCLQLSALHGKASWTCSGSLRCLLADSRKLSGYLNDRSRTILITLSNPWRRIDYYDSDSNPLNAETAVSSSVTAVVLHVRVAALAAAVKRLRNRGTILSRARRKLRTPLEDLPSIPCRLPAGDTAEDRSAQHRGGAHVVVVIQLTHGLACNVEARDDAT